MYQCSWYYHVHGLVRDHVNESLALVDKEIVCEMAAYHIGIMDWVPL